MQIILTILILGALARFAGCGTEPPDTHNSQEHYDDRRPKTARRSPHLDPSKWGPRPSASEMERSGEDASKRTIKEKEGRKK